MARQMDHLRMRKGVEQERQDQHRFRQLEAPYSRPGLWRIAQDLGRLDDSRSGSCHRLIRSRAYKTRSNCVADTLKQHIEKECGQDLRPGIAVGSRSGLRELSKTD